MNSNEKQLKVISPTPLKNDLRYKIYKGLSKSYVNSIIKLAIEKTEGNPKLHSVTPKQLEIIIEELGVPNGYKLSY